MSARAMSNVHVIGRGRQPMMFAHGFGCDQSMWRAVTPMFEDDYEIVLFDLVGSGKSDLRAYEEAKYATLKGHADDVLAICRELALEDVVFVGHSVSAMIGVIAAIAEPQRFARLVLVGPSPRYIDDDASGYRGGFSRADIEGLLGSLEENYLGWSSQMAPVIMGNPDRPELGQELTNSFCRTDPRIAKHFARVTFLSDNRADLQKVTTPSLILQCSNDAIAPTDVGEYCKRNIPRSELVVLDATGHCPHLSAPTATAAAIRDYLAAS
jgi:sigma-B regulation protein RsbQ